MKISYLFIGLILIAWVACWFTFDTAAMAGGDTTKSDQLEQSYVWYDGDRERKIWLNPKLVAEFNPGVLNQSPLKKVYPGAKALAPRLGGIRIWQLENSTSAEIVSRNLKTSHPDGRYAPIFHDGSTASSRMRSLPGNIIVYLNPDWDQSAVDSWASKRNLEIIKKLEIGPNIFVVKTEPGLEALEVANTLYQSGEVIAAFPDWWQEVVTR